MDIYVITKKFKRNYTLKIFNFLSNVKVLLDENCAHDWEAIWLLKYCKKNPAKDEIKYLKTDETRVEGWKF